jgi:hypothetical protein
MNRYPLFSVKNLPAYAAIMLLAQAEARHVRLTAGRCATASPAPVIP